MTVLLSFVMVSNFHYRSFKDMDFRERLPFWYLVIGVGLFAIIAIRPEVMLFLLFMTYAVLGAVFGVLGLGRAPKRHPAEAGAASDGDDLHELIEPPHESHRDSKQDSSQH
jgi:CDP-diacylglycerol--serine O-phosphatidyltransferase